ncbi:uncharacterized protein SOCE836_094630 [Sorangium cellulosum]|uniref:Uncharacterized protein n=1 Tax=Sorangium cellulosum TaxID=56 RepID=A0A4P2R3R8_SORCE|nr:uncharacterized protein SOCE836_094630 [Sorangium cellulosum]WCQ96530.1 hypothetical protein NQZ70_09317 [Sorangium sp. Soce836]
MHALERDPLTFARGSALTGVRRAGAAAGRPILRSSYLPARVASAGPASAPPAHRGARGRPVGKVNPTLSRAA